MTNDKPDKILVYKNGLLTPEDTDNHKRINRDRIKTLVVKSGTSVVTDNGSMNIPLMAEIARQLSIARKKYDIDIIYVSSGAIGFGMIHEGLRERPKDTAELMELSTTGQGILYATYSNFFSNYGVKTNQILVNEHDIESSNHIARLTDVIDVAFRKKKVPIINANDATWAYEIEQSDNDFISAVLAQKLQADLLVLLSNVDGIYTDNPKKSEARLISHICAIDDKLKNFADGKSALGAGGADSKLRINENYSGPYVVANGRKLNVVLNILEGVIEGSYFEGKR